jgi:hypothetical protein
LVRRPHKYRHWSRAGPSRARNIRLESL